MEKINDILKLLKEKKNFALTRFGDGELLGIQHVGLTVARGTQTISPALSELLKAAICHEQENYWKGIPCRTCWPQHRFVADQLVRPGYPWRTTAVVLTNRNWERVIDEVPPLLEGRTVYWVGGKSHKPENLKEIGIKISSHLKVPDQDAFASFEEILPLVRGLTAKSVVLLSCGPLSRVLAHQWFMFRQDITFLPVGDVFSPWIKEVYLRCHHSHFPDKVEKHPHCPECF